MNCFTVGLKQNILLITVRRHNLQKDYITFAC